MKSTKKGSQYHIFRCINYDRWVKKYLSIHSTFLVWIISLTFSKIKSKLYWFKLNFLVNLYNVFTCIEIEFPAKSVFESLWKQEKALILSLVEWWRTTGQKTLTKIYTMVFLDKVLIMLIQQDSQKCVYHIWYEWFS